MRQSLSWRISRLISFASWTTVFHQRQSCLCLLQWPLRFNMKDCHSSESLTQICSSRRLQECPLLLGATRRSQIQINQCGSFPMPLSKARRPQLPNLLEPKLTVSTTSIYLATNWSQQATTDLAFWAQGSSTSLTSLSRESFLTSNLTWSFA